MKKKLLLAAMAAIMAIATAMAQQIAVPISQGINNLQIALEIMKNSAADKPDEPAVKEEDI